MKLNDNKRYVSASTMKNRVKLFAPSISAFDAEASSTTTYTEQETVWGDWRPGEGSRTLQEMMLNFNAVGRLFIYYNVTINKFYQVEIDGIRYTIHMMRDYQDNHQYYELLIYTNDQ